MRVVALEEHFTVPALASKYVKPEAIAKRGHFKGRNVAPGKASPMELLSEIGEKRFKSLDDAGITVQVLSNSGAGPDLAPGPDGIALAIGAFDEPEEIAPVIQWGIEAKLPYVDDIPALPGEDTMADPKAVAFLSGLVSYQHPDRDTEEWPPAEHRK